MDLKTKLTETTTEIRNWLAGPCNPTNEVHRKAIERMMTAMWSRQTETEQTSKTTRHRNGRGFNARDAEFGGNFITYLKSHGQVDDRLGWMARRKLLKYSRQLAEIRVAKEMDANDKL